MAMLTDAADIDDLLESLEVRALANPDPQLAFALVTDLRDAAAEHLDGDAAVGDLAGQPGTVAAIDEADPQPPPLPSRLEHLHQVGAQLVHVELRGIDLKVSDVADRLQAPTLALDGAGNRAGPAQRMRPPRLAEAPQQGAVVGLQEHERALEPRLAPERPVHVREGGREAALAQVHHQRRVPQLRRAMPNAYVEMSRADARRLHIESGDTVRVPLTHVKVFGWYDNEMGSYTYRLGELTIRAARSM